MAAAAPDALSEVNAPALQPHACRRRKSRVNARCRRSGRKLQFDGIGVEADDSFAIGALELG